jgi:HSP20 family protein
MTLVRFNTPGLMNQLAYQALNNHFDHQSGYYGDCQCNSDVAYHVSENETEYSLQLAVPGLTKSDLKIEVDNGILSISTLKAEEAQPKVGFAAARFEKKFRLAKSINQEAIAAQTENGVLTVTLPKIESAIRKPVRSIEIA